MSSTITLYDPTAPPQAAGAQAQVPIQPVQLNGATVGFIDNAKPNFSILVDDLTELLTSQYGVKRVITRRKTSASIPATPDDIHALASECDVVITGSGD